MNITLEELRSKASVSELYLIDLVLSLSKRELTAEVRAEGRKAGWQEVHDTLLTVRDRQFHNPRGPHGEAMRGLLDAVLVELKRPLIPTP